MVRARPIKTRLEEKIEARGDCLYWTGYVDSLGYGRIQVKNTHAKTHRLSYETYKGPIPEGKCVLHRCDNRACINPDHLFLGTQQDNIQDMMQKGRHKTSKGTQNGNSLLTEIQVKAILKDTRWQKYIAADYGVSQQTISAIKTKSSWKHINENKPRN